MALPASFGLAVAMPVLAALRAAVSAALLRRDRSSRSAESLASKGRTVHPVNAKTASEKLIPRRGSFMHASRWSRRATRTGSSIWVLDIGEANRSTSQHSFRTNNSFTVNCFYVLTCKHVNGIIRARQSVYFWAHGYSRRGIRAREDNGGTAAGTVAGFEDPSDGRADRPSVRRHRRVEGVSANAGQSWREHAIGSGRRGLRLRRDGAHPRD